MASLNLYIVSFNCAQNLIDTAAVASQLFNGVEGDVLPDLLVLNLQEVAPLVYSLIGGSFLVPYLARFQDAVDTAASKFDGSRYVPIVTRHVGMTAIFLYAKDPAAIKSVETAGVGLGAMEMGNKGAVGVRIQYQKANGTENDSTELTFVSAHLAAMEAKVERRNEDWKNLVQKLVFTSTPGTRPNLARPENVNGVSEDERPLLSASSGQFGIYKPTSHLFVAGDLNYRTSTLGPSPDDHRNSFPQPTQDEADSQHHSNLFDNDQLNQERGAGRTLHGLIEAPVTFPPTYKYNPEDSFPVRPGTTPRWSWAKHRWPSWTDRILYLDIPSWFKSQSPQAEIVAHEYIALPLFSTSDHRGVALEFTVPATPIPTPDEDLEGVKDPRVKPPFDIDPQWRTKRERARALELVVGFGMYFGTTWEGRGVVFATALGMLGGYYILKALLDF